MAKASAKPKAAAGGAENTDPTAGKVRSARGLLIAALVLSAMSLGGGFVLARFAYQSDAEAFEPDYVEEAAKEDSGGEKEDGEEVYEGDEDGKTSEEGEEEIAIEGMLEFEDIMTDITSYDISGKSARSFLKLSLRLVYRPEPGARELLLERQPFMRDLFTTYVRSLTEAEVRGAAGLLTIKAELLKRARAATGNNVPQDVLIRDLIVQ